MIEKPPIKIANSGMVDPVALPTLEVILADLSIHVSFREWFILRISWIGYRHLPWDRGQAQDMGGWNHQAWAPSGRKNPCKWKG